MCFLFVPSLFCLLVEDILSFSLHSAFCLSPVDNPVYRGSKYTIVKSGSFFFRYKKSGRHCTRNISMITNKLQFYNKNCVFECSPVLYMHVHSFEIEINDLVNPTLDGIGGRGVARILEKRGKNVVIVHEARKKIFF